MPRQNEMGSMRRPGKTGNASASYTSSSSSRGATGGTRYCVLYDSTTNFTEDCYTIAKMKRDRSRGCGGAPSGEAERPVKQKIRIGRCTTSANNAAAESDDDTVIASLVAACSQVNIMVLKTKIGRLRASFAVDIGASVNVLSERAYLALKRAWHGS